MYCGFAFSVAFRDILILAALSSSRIFGETRAISVLLSGYT